MKNKRCSVYYHFIGNTVAHRVVIWPDKTVMVQKVRVNPALLDEMRALNEKSSSNA